MKRTLARIATFFADKPASASPVIQAVYSRRAWARFQNDVKAKREAARADHKATRDINAAQQERVHAALRAGRT